MVTVIIAVSFLSVYLKNVPFPYLAGLKEAAWCAQAPVVQVTVDFETAMWKALRSVLPAVQLQGWVFHLTQALWRRVSYLKRTPNSIRKSIINYFRHFTKAIFLLLGARTRPTGTVHKRRGCLSIHSKADGPAIPSTSWDSTHVRSAQRSGTVWTPPHPDPLHPVPVDWEHHLRTKGLECLQAASSHEQWHRGMAALNKWAGSRCSLLLYSLIKLLDREARITTIIIRLVSDKKLKRIQRKRYQELQAKPVGIVRQPPENRCSAGLLTAQRTSTRSVNLTETSICENYVHRFS